MEWKIKIYQVLVNRVPAIQKKYHQLRQQKTGRLGRIYAWIVLLFMNVVALLFPKKYETDFYDLDKEKKIPSDKSESSLSLRESPKELAERLKNYDVISFDIFDTLLFRPFASPTDLFFAVGEQLQYMDFEQIRKAMEWQARQKRKAQTGSYEITLEDIYREIEKQTGIPKEKGMQLEIEIEKKLCFANSYMLEVIQNLKNCGKTLICTSDMYLPSSVLQTIVENCGFQGITKYFVSCEYEVSKSNGMLFQKVKETYGAERTYVHIGDNTVSDIESAKKNGWEAIWYQNVNQVGMPYRTNEMAHWVGSIYAGIVNAHMHNGLQVYSREYEYGFVYGGLFVLGYCQWIHTYVKQNAIDKILFLSRDGDILCQVYKMLYPKESSNDKAEYVYWSRLVATKLSAKKFKYDYFRRFIDHKINQNYTLEQIFKSMEIEDMLELMCEELPVFAEILLVSNSIFEQNRLDVKREGKITMHTKLTDNNAWLIKEYLIAHWEQVLAHYEEQLLASKAYYERVLAGCKRVVAVDIGWAGSGAITLNHLVNDRWNLGCEVIGLLAGSNTIYNTEPNMSEMYFQNGTLVSYLFSQGHNRDIWKWHDAAKGHNLGIELLCSSVQGSLKGFYLDKQNEYKLVFKTPDVKETMVQEIQKGIKDFVSLMQDVAEKGQLTWTIHGADAYAPIKLLMKNQKILEEWLKGNLEVNL